MPDQNRPATDKQRAALAKWHAKVPDQLSVKEASDWMDALSAKSRSGQKITEQDLSGPPTFHPGGVPPARTAPLPPPSPPVSKPPVPPESNGNGHPPSGEPLPCSDAWFTGQVNVVRDAKGTILSVDRMAKVADHAFPGESHDSAIARVMAKAEKAVGL